MTYELEKLNNIIYSDLDKLTNKTNRLKPDDIDYWVSTIDTEVKRIKKAFIEVAFGTENEKQIERYMSHHQVDLIRLTDRLLHYLGGDESLKMNDRSNDPLGTQLLKHAYGFLDDLINYLENHFSRFFNLDASVPRSYKLIAIRDFKEKLECIDDLSHARNLDDHLLNVITSPLRRLIRSKEEELTFRKLIYFKRLVLELENYFKTESREKEQVQDLFCAMIYMNFNSYKFFAYCTEFIKSQYQNKETLTDQLDNLALTSKMINQTQQKPGVAYKPERQPIKRTLIAWIDEEIAFLEKRHQLTFNMSMPQVDPGKDFKLNTSLSVAQLAYFVRVLIEEKVLINSNQREVLKFFAQFTRTKKAENVSAESLRTRYYNIDTSTKEAVKDITIKLLNNIRKKT
ncbi:MAG: hypothetical protein ABJN36_17635 [Cyclobacteriaceae bacterium]